MQMNHYYRVLTNYNRLNSQLQICIYIFTTSCPKKDPQHYQLYLENRLTDFNNF